MPWFHRNCSLAFGRQMKMWQSEPCPPRIKWFSLFVSNQGQYFSLELNMQELNAIDFSKGCYVGQENTARMSLKEKISKKLFRLNNESTLSSGEELFFNNEIIGKIVSENPNFAMIKMSKFSEFNDKDLKTQNDIKVKISKPNWMN